MADKIIWALFKNNINYDYVEFTKYEILFIIKKKKNQTI